MKQTSSEYADDGDPLYQYASLRPILGRGMVHSKHSQIEKYDDLLGRIAEAAQYVPYEQLALSPQCGFASVAEGNLLSSNAQRRKLVLVVETALSACTRRQRCQFVGSMPAGWQRVLGTGFLVTVHFISYLIVFQ